MTVDARQREEDSRLRKAAELLESSRDQLSVTHDNLALMGHGLHETKLKQRSILTVYIITSIITIAIAAYIYIF